MVCLPLKEDMEEHYASHLEEFVAQHPGEYLIYHGEVKPTFYKTKDEANASLEKYDGCVGQTLILRQIPLVAPKRKTPEEIRADEERELVERLRQIRDFEQRSREHPPDFKTRFE